MQAAYEMAQIGIAALDGGDFDTAKSWYERSKGLYIKALEAKLRPSDWVNLEHPAAPRGRPKKSAPVAKGPPKKRGRPRNN
jgi:hypothetical protein